MVEKSTEQLGPPPSQEGLTGFVCTGETCVPDKVDEVLRTQIEEALKGKPVSCEELFPLAKPEK